MLKSQDQGLDLERLACYAAWPQPVSNGQGDVVLGADVQDVVPVRVGKVLLLVQQGELRHHTEVSIKAMT